MLKNKIKKFMSKKIPHNKLKGLQEIEKIKRHHLYVANSLELSKRIELNQILKELGYDLTKSYDVNLDNGKIVEKKEEELNNNKQKHEHKK